MNISKLFHTYDAIEAYIKQWDIKEYTIVKQNNSNYLLNYNVLDDRRDFIIGALVGYLEDKDDRAGTLEQIAAEVAKYFRGDFNYIEIY